MKLYKFMLLVLFVPLSGEHKQQIKDATVYFYYTKSAPTSSHPDQYVVLESRIHDNVRDDRYYHYVFNGKKYDFEFCHSDRSTLENDSLLVTDQDSVTGKKSYKTKFKLNVCDTTLRYQESANQEIEIVCYLGKKSIKFNGRNFVANHLKLAKKYAHGSEVIDAYFDSNMYLIYEEGNAIFGFGRYKTRQIDKLPFDFDFGQRCQ